MERIQRGDEGGERGDILSNLLHAKQPETGEPYNQRELMGEAILLLLVHPFPVFASQAFGIELTKL